MELINGTGFALTGGHTLDKDGTPWLIVAAKASYAIGADGDPKLSEQQPDFLVSDVYEGEVGRSSPLLEQELVPGKPQCDVVVKGHVHAPDGRPVTETMAGLSVGPIDKVVRVLGDRRWTKGLTGFRAGEPEPFVKMPLSYGRAFGGHFEHHDLGSDDPSDHLTHPQNLAGCGYARGPFLKLLDGAPMPNLEAPDHPITDPSKLYAPMSFGPIGRNWEPRLQLGGSYGDDWQSQVFPSLPADFDKRYHQCVPADQQMPYPQGGEEIKLLNMLPGGGATVFSLPELTLSMVALMRSGRVRVLEPVVDTIIIDTDESALRLIWRARVQLRRSLREVDAVAAGRVCKRWWKSRVFGSEDCGCGGFETNDEDLAPVTEALA